MARRVAACWIGVACCSGLAACSMLVGRYGPVDPRHDRPAPEIYDGTVALPGQVVNEPAEIEGIWSFFRTERTQLDGGRTAPLYYALHLKLEPDNRYELVYQAYVGTRSESDPAMHAVDVRETGVFSLAARVLRLEPSDTRLTEKQSGRLTTQAIPDENRRYVAALDGAYLNIAGPCARYQVEPICRRNRDVWYSLRLGMMDWPVPPLK